jgi:hypothetical protein
MQLWLRCGEPLNRLKLLDALQAHLSCDARRRSLANIALFSNELLVPSAAINGQLGCRCINVYIASVLNTANMTEEETLRKCVFCASRNAHLFFARSFALPAEVPPAGVPFVAIKFRCIGRDELAFVLRQHHVPSKLNADDRPNPFRHSVPLSALIPLTDSGRKWPSFAAVGFPAGVKGRAAHLAAGSVLVSVAARSHGRELHERRWKRRAGEGYVAVLGMVTSCDVNQLLGRRSATVFLFKGSVEHEGVLHCIPPHHARNLKLGGWDSPCSTFNDAPLNRKRMRSNGAPEPLLVWLTDESLCSEVEFV